MKYGLRFRRTFSAQSSGKAKFLSPNLKSIKSKSRKCLDRVEVSSTENGGDLPPTASLDLEDEEDEEGPKTPPSSPNQGLSDEKRAIKRTFSGESKEETESVQISPETSPSIHNFDTSAKRFKESSVAQATEGRNVLAHSNASKGNDLQDSVGSGPDRSCLISVRTSKPS